MQIHCGTCEKPQALCICDSIKPLENKLEVLLLQHPQEFEEDLNTARLTHLLLKNSKLKVGLSWRNLIAQPKHWVVLFLGSSIESVKHKQQQTQVTETQSRLIFLNKKRQVIEGPSRAAGLVVLDGTWSQAKTLWWRNPWLLKLNRAILVPASSSLYQDLRREPRPECLSTLEAVAESLTLLGESPAVEQGLKNTFRIFLERYRACQ